MNSNNSKVVVDGAYLSLSIDLSNFDGIPFNSAGINEQINDGTIVNTILKAECGTIILCRSFEIYYFGTDKLCLTRNGSHTKAYLYTKDKYDREVKKYFIDGKRRRKDQYTSYHL